MDLLRTLRILETHSTEALSEAAFEAVRTKERVRHWSLWALVQFWTAIVLRAPQSLSHALSQMREGREAGLPRIPTSDEAFFERCRDLSWTFFAEVFHRFVESLLPRVEPRFCRELEPLRERFGDVLVLDGSRLAKIARKLKILWDERRVILPGCLLVVYDLFRGIPRGVQFTVDAAASEAVRAREVLSSIASGTLLLGDRLYCTASFFEALRERGIYGLFRRNKQLGLRRLSKKPLSKCRWNGGRLTEVLVEAGCGVSAPIQRLRWIRWKKGSRIYDVLTNVLEPQRLSAEEAIRAYPCRWSVERMYFDLKVVLNLNRIYAANPNAVGMQVYASALVYTALRVAQGEIAHEAGIAPEEISPAKFFPKMAAACHDYVVAEFTVEEMIRLNPGKDLVRPDWKGRKFTTVELETLLVRERDEHRRKRRFCKARRRWKSITKVAGGQHLS